MANWSKEVARDLIAFGSLPFYLVVVVRAVIGEHQLFFSLTVIALILLTFVSFFVEANMHIARGLLCLALPVCFIITGFLQFLLS